MYYQGYLSKCLALTILTSISLSLPSLFLTKIKAYSMLIIKLNFILYLLGPLIQLCSTIDSFNLKLFSSYNSFTIDTSAI